MYRKWEIITLPLLSPPIPQPSPLPFSLDRHWPGNPVMAQSNSTVMFVPFAEPSATQLIIHFLERSGMFNNNVVRKI